MATLVHDCFTAPSLSHGCPAAACSAADCRLPDIVITLDILAYALSDFGRRPRLPSHPRYFRDVHAPLMAVLGDVFLIGALYLSVIGQLRTSLWCGW